MEQCPLWPLAEGSQLLGLAPSPAQMPFSGAERSHVTLWQVCPGYRPCQDTASLRCPARPPRASEAQIPLGTWVSQALLPLVGSLEGVGRLLLKAHLSTCSSPSSYPPPL